MEQLTPDHLTEKQLKKGEEVFRLRLSVWGPKRQLYFTCQDEAELRNWRRAISKVLKSRFTKEELAEKAKAAEVCESKHKLQLVLGSFKLMRLLNSSSAASCSIAG
jgi:hypothetical protein